MDEFDLAEGHRLRRPGPPRPVEAFDGVRIDDPRLAAVLPGDAPLLELHAGAIHLEGPVWQPDRARLLASDVPNRRLIAWYEEDGRVEVAIATTHFANGNARMPDGAIVHCEHGRRCISRSPADVGADRRAEPEPIVTRYDGRRINSPNDLAVAPDGAIWFTDPIFGIVMPSQGSLAEPELDHRSVYRFDPATGETRRMADFEQPNGLAFSPDGGTLYVTDTSVSLGEVPGFEAGARRDIEAFDVAADGTLSNRRPFARVEPGYPDGILVDPRGWLWSSAADGVHVFSAEGERLGLVPTPSTVSNLTLGGADGRRLFLCATATLLAIDLAA